MLGLLAVMGFCSEYDACSAFNRTLARRSCAMPTNTRMAQLQENTRRVE